MRWVTIGGAELTGILNQDNKQLSAFSNKTLSRLRKYSTKIMFYLLTSHSSNWPAARLNYKANDIWCDSIEFMILQLEFYKYVTELYRSQPTTLMFKLLRLY